MKKILLLSAVTFLILTGNAQQTEDDIFVGKSRTFGNYRGTDVNTAKQIKGRIIITGVVEKTGWCEEDCITVWVKKEDGSTVSVGTKEYGFTVPKNIVGKKIIIEAAEPATYTTQKKKVKKEYQKDIQVAATGIRIFD
ncbi:MAG TPA: DUF4920 domain-containing protein [Flavisolibacter sp.]